MLKRLVAGGVAGTIATLPMSGVVWGFKKIGLYRSRPHPERVSEGLAAKVIDVRELPRPARKALNLTQHFGFGAAGGAAYSLVTIPLKPGLLTGALTALVMWKASYDGWIPNTGILPPPEKDEQGRVRTTIAAHVVYGATMGLILRWWSERVRRW